MTYFQIVQPNLSVTGKSGYCLEMQENVWGSAHWYNFAEQAWNQNHPNHPGELPPNVCVPVYWTYFDSADNTEYGHVATWVPGRGVYSSTFNTALGAEWYPSIQAMTDRINQIPHANSRYLGWSEVIANLTLVKGDIMPPIGDESTVRSMAATLGVPLTDAEVTYYAARSYGEFDANVLGVVNQNRLDALKKVDDLTAANQKLVDQLTALKATPVVSPAPDPSVTVTQTGLWAAFKRFLGL